MEISIEANFSIYDKSALEVVKEEIKVFKIICDHVTDVAKLKKLVDSTSFHLELQLSAIFAELGAKYQPQAILDHYAEFDFTKIINSFLDIFKSESVKYLKEKGKYA